MDMSQDKEFVTKDYWEKRYETSNSSYEWTTNYEGLKGFGIDRFIKKTDTILFPGCVLCHDMYVDGYHNLVAVDISETVITQNLKRDKDLKGLKYLQMDCFALQFESQSFNSVIDKSTLDTFLCSEEMFDNVPLYLDGVCKVLKPKGYFLIVSFNPPEAMEMVFTLNENFSYELAMRHWEDMIGLESLKELYPDIAEEDTKGMYTYLYVLQKK